MNYDEFEAAEIRAFFTPTTADILLSGEIPVGWDEVDQSNLDDCLRRGTQNRLATSE